MRRQASSVVVSRRQSSSVVVRRRQSSSGVVRRRQGVVRIRPPSSQRTDSQGGLQSGPMANISGALIFQHHSIPLLCFFGPGQKTHMRPASEERRAYMLEARLI